MNETLLYIAAAMLAVWGIAHIIPARAIIKGFGEISADNKKVLAMEIIAEGLTLIFLGALPVIIILAGYPKSVNGVIVYRAEAVMLFAMAILTLATGARTPAIWYKICPAVKATAALLLVLGSIIL